jgi:heat shock protein HslJ
MVSGVWPQAHMKGAQANMLCLYNRRTGRAETKEVTARTYPTPAAEAQIKDLWWRAEDVGGGGVIDDARVTLQFGSDGKVAGKSGCNNYSVNYTLSGSALKVDPPMIGTRMMCPPALMALEAKLRKLLSGATEVVVRPGGRLMLRGADGQSLRFVREP